MVTDAGSVTTSRMSKANTYKINGKKSSSIMYFGSTTTNQAAANAIINQLIAETYGIGAVGGEGYEEQSLRHSVYMQ